MTDPLFAVMGPTASGKTALAMALAERTQGEIVSCDSAAVFRGLDVGTAKPTEEERARVPHWLINTINPTEQWSAAQFAEHADAAIADIRSRGRTPILCGGTGLWMRALVRGIFVAPPIDQALKTEIRAELAEKGAPAMHAALHAVDPVAADRIAQNDPQRIGRALEVFRQTGTPISELQDAHAWGELRYRLIGVAIDWPVEEHRARVAARARWMYENGLVEETVACLENGTPPDAPGLRIIGYRDVVRHLAGELTLDAARTETTTQTRRFAKRQRNWFKGESEVHPVSPDLSPDAVLDLMNRRR